MFTVPATATPAQIAPLNENILARHLSDPRKYLYAPSGSLLISSIDCGSNGRLLFVAQGVEGGDRGLFPSDANLKLTMGLLGATSYGHSWNIQCGPHASATGVVRFVQPDTMQVLEDETDFEGKVGLIFYRASIATKGWRVGRIYPGIDRAYPLSHSVRDEYSGSRTRVTRTQHRRGLSFAEVLDSAPDEVYFLPIEDLNGVLHICEVCGRNISTPRVAHGQLICGAVGCMAGAVHIHECTCGSLITSHHSSNGSGVLLQGTRQSDGRIVCPTCRETMTQDLVLLKSHHYKPSVLSCFTKGQQTQTFSVGKDRTPYLGVEYEVELAPGTRDTALIQVNKLAKIGPKSPPWCFTKHDGSLAYGFELVTYPASLEVHKEEFPWGKTIEELRRYGMNPDGAPSAGIHIHLNRKALTTTNERKLAYFMYTHKTKMIQAARRRPNSYCTFNAIPSGIACPPTESSRLTSDSRYESLNWQNANTVEFRMFKSTGRVEHLFASMELVDALANYVPTVDSDVLSDRRKAWRQFWAFMTAQQDTYSNILQLLSAQPEAEEGDASCV